MMGLKSFRIGSIFGIPVEVHASWFLVFFLVAASMTTSYLPAALPGYGSTVHALLAFVMALAFFGSILLHELSHSLVARAGGLRVSKVTLFVFGGVSQMDDEPKRPGHELLLAIAGPAMSVLIALVGFGLTALLHGTPKLVTEPVRYLAVINLSVAAFNLLPGFPLDGGRVLRAVLWALTKDQLKATRWASGVGQAIGYALMATAVFGVLNGTLDFIWLAVMGWFLTMLATSAYRQHVVRAQLSQVPLSRIMTADVVLVPAATTLEEMAHSYFLGGRHARYPVVDEGRVVGLVELQATRDVPREQWQEVTARDVAYRDLEHIVARPDTPVERVLPLLEPDAHGAVLVVEEGRLAGIVTRADVIGLLSDGRPVGDMPS